MIESFGKQSLRQHLARERDTLLSLDGRSRLQYVWDYYKIPIGAAAIILALLISSVCYTIGRGRTVLYAVFVNCTQDTQSTLLTDLLQDSGTEMKGKNVDTQTRYTLNFERKDETDLSTMQVLSALFGIGDMDLFAADPSVFSRYAQKDAFENLGVLLPQSLKEQYADSLYYYENTYGAEIIGGVWLRSGSALHAAGYYGDDVLIGIPTQAQHLEEALTVLEKLLQTNPQ